MRNKYGFNLLGYIILLLFVILGVFAITLAPDTINMKILLPAVLIGFFAFILLLLSQIIIDEKGLIARINFNIYNRLILSWNEITSIRDDAFLMFHLFHINGIGGADRKRKLLIYGNIFFNKHKEFLQEVISKVPPNTPVDDSILNRINFTNDDIGRHFQK